MCSGYSSSRIAAEEKAIWNNRINEKQINSDDINRIYQLLEPELQTVEKFYFAGGEPLLMPEHYKLLKTLIDSSICDVPIEYSTNLTSLHYKDKYIVDLWKHFSNIKVGCSIDATGPRATYQRHGTVWKDIKNNIRCIQEEAPNVKIIITSVLTVFNSLHLQDVQRELIDNLKINPEHIISSIASAPDFLSISILPNGLKNEFILKSTAHIEYLRTVKDTQNLCKWWSDAVQYVQDNDNSHLILKFMEHNKTLDNHRNESFVTVYPELAELFNT
jgi:sulfatase maturation enzyme AslB (radical SAM superfamily)